MRGTKLNNETALALHPLSIMKDILGLYIGRWCQQFVHMTRDIKDTHSTIPKVGSAI